MGISLTKLDAAKIETALYNFIRPMFTESDVYVMGGDRVSSVNPLRQVYCRAPVDIIDWNAYGSTYSKLEIYVKKKDGIKNIAELSRIRDLILTSLQNGVKLGDYRFDYMSEINGDDRAGFNYIFLNLATKIL